MRTPWLCATWLLAATVFLSLNPPYAIVYLDPQEPDGGITERVTRETCPYLRVDQIPLPISFEVRWLRKVGEAQSYVPDADRRIQGLIVACP